jgi:hypothetical protein
MVGVTLLGLFLTPVFYVTIRNILLRFTRRKLQVDTGSPQFAKTSAE